MITKMEVAVRSFWVMSFFVAVSSLGSALGEEEKRPLPNDAAQAESLSLVRDIYKDDWKAAKLPAQKEALVKKLVEAAGETTDDDTSRFVLLRVARDMAVQNGDVRTAIAVVDQMCQEYAVDAVAIRWEATQFDPFVLAGIKHAGLKGCHVDLHFRWQWRLRWTVLLDRRAVKVPQPVTILFDAGCFVPAHLSVDVFFAAVFCIQNVDTGCLFLSVFPAVTSEHTTKALDALPYRTRGRDDDSNIHCRYIETFDQRPRRYDDLSRSTAEQVKSRLAN